MKKECDFCGAENEDWMKICINCGNELKDAEPVKEAVVEKTTTSVGHSASNNPNSLLILILIVLGVVMLILLFAVVSKFS